MFKVITATCSGSDIFKPTTKGNIKTSSTSNTKNTRATRKNRIENGSRAPNLGVKPHSKGLVFSRSGNNFTPKITPKQKTKITMIAAVRKAERKNNIKTSVAEIMH